MLHAGGAVAFLARFRRDPDRHVHLLAVEFAEYQADALRAVTGDVLGDEPGSALVVDPTETADALGFDPILAPRLAVFAELLGRANREQCLVFCAVAERTQGEVLPAARGTIERRPFESGVEILQLALDAIARCLGQCAELEAQNCFGICFRRAEEFRDGGQCLLVVLLS